MSLDLDPSVIWRDFTTDGIPASGAHDPRKVEIRQHLTALRQAVIALLADADPGLALPNLLIRATDAGVGTPNAIQATTNLPIPDGDATALIALNIFEPNTASPVTVSLNGGAALTIKSNSGNDVVAGGLVGNVLGLRVGTTFQLFSEQVSAALVAAAEAYAADAEASKDAAAAEAAGITIRDFPTRAAAALATIPALVMHVRTAGREAVNDWGAAVYYRKSAPEVDRAGDFTSANGVRFGLIKQTLRPQMFGALYDPPLNTGERDANTLLFRGMFQTARDVGATEIDARGIGNVDFNGSPFPPSMHTLPVLFRTGASRFRDVFSGNWWALPSFFTWKPEGTTVAPLGVISNIGGINSPGAGLVQTYLGGGDGRTATGFGSTVTVSSADGIHVGTAISIYGTVYDFTFQFELADAITATTTLIPVANTGAGQPPSGTIDPGFIIMRINSANGLELVRGLYQGGVLDTSVAGGGRGMYGTAAVAHPAAASMLLATTIPRKVIAKLGNVLTVEPPLAVAANGNPMNFGSVDTRIDGKLEIDGGFDRATSPTTNVWSCLGSTLSSGFRASGGVKLRRGNHGGYFFIGTLGLVAEFDLIDMCGKPTTSLGASGWLFGDNYDISVSVKEVRDGYIACAIDNKSSGVIGLNLVGPNRRFSVKHDRQLLHRAGFDVTASFDGYCWAGYSDCEDSHAGIFNGLPQQWTAISPTGVTIEIGRMKAFKNPTGNAIGNNIILLEGRRERFIEATSTIPNTSSPANADATVDLTGLGDTRIGDRVDVFFQQATITPPGVVYVGAYVHAAGAVRLVFKNVSGTGQTIASQAVKLTCRGPW